MCVAGWKGAGVTFGNSVLFKVVIITDLGQRQKSA